MAQPPCKRPHTDKMAEVRVALRAAERAEWIGNPNEIKLLEKQAETVGFENPVGKDAELDFIIQQLQQKAAKDRQKAMHDTNKLQTFTCAICIDKMPLDHLRVNEPCGHGFCKACIDDAWHAHGAPAAPDCFTCRTKVANVMKIYF